MKLKAKDIKIKGEGAQVKSLIIKKYGALDPFIKIYTEKHKDIVNQETFRNYLNCRTIRSKSFKIRLMYDLDIDFDKDVVSEEKQIAAYIENINANINEYQSKDDIPLFSRLDSLCIKHASPELLSKLYKTESAFYSNCSEAKESIKYLYMAIDNEKNPRILMQYYSDLGLQYYNEKEIDMAKTCYKEANKLLSNIKINIGEDISLLYYRMGILLSSENNTEIARQMFFKAIENTEKTTEKGSCLLSIGLSYKRDKNYKMAIEYYQKALDLFESIKEYRKMAFVYNNFAELYRVKGNYKIGLGYIETAMTYWDYLNESNKAVLTHTYYQISVALNTNVKFDKLIEVLKNTDGKCKYKNIIIEILETVIQYGKIKSIGILYQVKDIINDYLHRPIFDSFCEEILQIHWNISLYLEKAERR